MSEPADLSELIALLNSELSTWVRLAVTDTGESSWELRTLEVTLGAPPPRWQPLDWRYPKALLQASRAEGEVVATWLRQRKIKLSGRTVSLESLQGNAMTERQPSGWSRAGHERLEWPADEWRIGLNQSNSFQGELISDRDVPSFVSFDVANANLLGVTLEPNWVTPSSELVVRRQDTTGRLSRVFVDFTEVVVTVEGKDLGAATTVELAGQVPGKAQHLQRRNSQTVRFPTPAGLPAGAWVLMRKDGTWVDRRTLWNDRTLAQEPGVEFAEAEPTAGMDSFFSEREQTEIKEAIAAAKAFVLIERSAQLTGADVRALQQSLDDLNDLVSTLKRRQWISEARGALVTLVFEQLVPQGVVLEVFRIMLHAVPHLLPLNLPALLP